MYLIGVRITVVCFSESHLGESLPFAVSLAPGLPAACWWVGDLSFLSMWESRSSCKAWCFAQCSLFTSWTGLPVLSSSQRGLYACLLGLVDQDRSPDVWMHQKTSHLWGLAESQSFTWFVQQWLSEKLYKLILLIVLQGGMKLETLHFTGEPRKKPLCWWVQKTWDLGCSVFIGGENDGKEKLEGERRQSMTAQLNKSY